MWLTVARWTWLVPCVVVLLYGTIRVVRYFHKFPMPYFLAGIIDNPVRRLIQPPAETARRHGLNKGMRVLEIGPGSGRYTIASARAVEPDGLVVTIDIEKRIIDRVSQRVEQENVANVVAEVANVYELPYEGASFDLAYMIAVINEIPEPERALRELHRVLRPDGFLVLSELLCDPDYVLASTLAKRVQKAGFALCERKGNFLYYTLKFTRVSLTRLDVHP